MTKFSRVAGISIPSELDIEDLVKDPNIDANKVDDFLPQSSLYMQSEFINDIQEKVSLLINLDSSNKIVNSVYNEQLSSYLLRKLGPFCALWSSFLHQRETNSIVESHNKVIKRDLLKDANIKPGRAIKELRADILAQLKIERSFDGYKKIKKTASIVDDPIETFKSPKTQCETNFSQVLSIEKEMNKFNQMFNSLDIPLVIKQLDDFNTTYRTKFFQIQIGYIKLTKSDLSCLDGSSWLNDNVVNAYINLLNSWNRDIGVVDTFFFAKIEACEPEHSYPLLKNIEFFNK